MLAFRSYSAARFRKRFSKTDRLQRADRTERRLQNIYTVQRKLHRETAS